MSFLSLFDALQHALTTPLCRDCGKRLPLPVQSTTRFCQDCREGMQRLTPSRTSLIISGASLPVWQHAACLMSSRMKRTLYDYKFYDQQQNKAFLSHLLIDYWDEVFEVHGQVVHLKQTAVIVIPPHPQDALNSDKAKAVKCRLSPIAASFARACGFDHIKDALTWTRPCIPQHTLLNRHERLKNLRGGLQLRSSQLIRYQRVIILDDIRTTGATFAEAVRAIGSEIDPNQHIEMHTLAMATVSYQQNFSV